MSSTDEPRNPVMPPRPRQLDLNKEQGLSVLWEDGRKSFYPIPYLRKLSPSADMKALREQIAKNPLTVLPASAVSKSSEPIRATGAELVGNYAIKNGGAGIINHTEHSWEYLREIDPSERPEAR